MVIPGSVHARSKDCALKRSDQSQGNTRRCVSYCRRVNSRLPTSGEVTSGGLRGGGITPGIVVLVSIRLLEVIPVALLVAIPAVAIVLLVAAVVARAGVVVPVLLATGWSRGVNRGVVLARPRSSRQLCAVVAEVAWRRWSLLTR